MARTKQTTRRTATNQVATPAVRGRVVKQSGGKEPRKTTTPKPTTPKQPAANSMYTKKGLKAILLEQCIHDCIFCTLKFQLQEELKERVRTECKNLKITTFLERQPTGLYKYSTKSAKDIRDFRAGLPQIEEHIRDIGFGDDFCIWPIDFCTFLMKNRRFPFRFNQRKGFGATGAFKDYAGREEHEIFLENFIIKLSEEKINVVIIPLIFYGAPKSEEREKGENNNSTFNKFHHISMLYLYKVYLEDGSHEWECEYVESCNQYKVTSLVLGRRILQTFLSKTFGKRINIKGRIWDNTTWNTCGTFFLAMLITLRLSGKMDFPTSPGVLEGLKLRLMDEKRKPVLIDVPSKEQFGGWGWRLDVRKFAGLPWKIELPLPPV